MKSSFPPLIGIAIILLSPLNIKGQYVVEGKIINSINEPMELVNVVLYRMPDTTFITGTTTMKDGVYKLSVNTAGPYLLEASFIGYKKLLQTVDINSVYNHLGSIILEEDNNLLDEITVTAILPQFSLKNGVLVTDVSNTLLSKEHSLTDVLTKIPGIIDNKGTIEIFGSGQPVYYINNRKVKNNDEIGQLNVQNIQKIELITNPGSKYDADANAIIKIYTMKKENGWSIQVGMLAKQSEKFSHRENVMVGYKKDKLNASIYYSFYDYKNVSFQYLEKEVYADTIWKYTTDRRQFPKSKIHNYNFSTDYEITSDQVVGFQMIGSKSNNQYITVEQNKVDTNSVGYFSFESPNTGSNITNNFQLNLFYNAKWNNKLSSSFNMDYVCYNDNQRQYIQEIMPEKIVETDSKLHSNYNIYATEFILNYKANEDNSWSCGTDYSYISGNGLLNIQSDVLKGSKYTSGESKYAGFIEYDFKKEKFSLNTGVRYEYTNRKYTDLVDKENNLSYSEHNFYPSAAISYAKNGISNTVSFSVKTARPALSYLNSRTYYQNRFLYQKGNPNLTPQTSYILDWAVGHKFINFRTSYTRTNNFITNTYIENPENHSTIISTWQNFKKAEFFKANLNLHHSFEFWEPSLSIGIIKPFLSSTYLGEIIHYNKLNFYISCNNYFKLPANYTLSIDYYYNNGGNQRIFLFKPFQSLNMSLQKSFLNEKLNLKLSADDIFRKLDYYENAKINKFTFYQNENYSSWNFSLSLIYRLNHLSIKYRGKSAADEEKNRL
jgi:hypothetical protein